MSSGLDETVAEGTGEVKLEAVGLDGLGLRFAMLIYHSYWNRDV
jgi:hypothetical protein